MYTVQNEYHHAEHDTRYSEDMDEPVHSVLVEFAIVEYHGGQIDTALFISSQLFQFLFGLRRHY